MIAVTYECRDSWTTRWRLPFGQSPFYPLQEMGLELANVGAVRQNYYDIGDWWVGHPRTQHSSELAGTLEYGRLRGSHMVIVLGLDIIIGSEGHVGDRAICRIVIGVVLRSQSLPISVPPGIVRRP